MTADDEPVFLDVDEVLEIHGMQLERYGGGAGTVRCGMVGLEK